MPALHQQSTAESVWSTDSAATSPQLYSDSSPSPTDSGSLKFTLAEMLGEYKPTWTKGTHSLGMWRPHSTSSPVPSLDNQVMRPPSFSPFGSSFPLDSQVSWYNRNNSGFDIHVAQPFSPISPVGGPAPNAIRGYSPDNQHSDCSSPLMESFTGLNRTSHSTSPSNSDSSYISGTDLPNMVQSLNLSGGVFSPPTEQELANLRALHSLTWTANESLDMLDSSPNVNKNQAVPGPATSWCGVLTTQVYEDSMVSSKVFLGGVPWDVSEEALISLFSEFGKVKVEWPGKDHAASHPKGYVYIVYESEKQVKTMLINCPRKVSTRKGTKWYTRISSKKMKSKEIQVIPWALNNSNHVVFPAQKLDPRTTVFVGALHGMLTAEGLFKVMNDLFGGVVYAGIDTDKFKYPIGSARVTFNNINSYIQAVKAAFVEITTTKFTKKVQVDPYLEDSPCSNCKFQQGPYFCREFTCFRYFCRSCWMVHELLTNHDYITRTSKNSNGHPTQMRFSSGNPTQRFSHQ